MKNIKKLVVSAITMALLTTTTALPIVFAAQGEQTFKSGIEGQEVNGHNKAALNVKATAYAPGPHDNGQWGNLTYMGTQIRPGVIAVDPRIIPLGSRLYIEFADGTSMYGVAEDIGGAIKGNKIDIAMQTVDQAYNFGIQDVKVYVLN